MDTLRINFANNPDLKDYFSRKKSGDECEITATFVVKNVGDGEVTGSLSDVSLPEEDMMGEKESEMSAEKPAAIEINAGSD